MILPYVLAGAFLYRLRGGISWAKLPGTQLARAAFSGPTGLLVWHLGVDWPAALAVAVLTFGGLVYGWGRWFDIGRNHGPAWRDALYMSARGLLITVPAGAALWWAVGTWAYMPAGLALGPLYAAAWAIPSTIPNLQRGPPMAEVFTGAWLWGVLSVALAG